MESSTVRTFYPNATRLMKERRERHPIHDCIDDLTTSMEYGADPYTELGLTKPRTECALTPSAPTAAAEEQQTLPQRKVKVRPQDMDLDRRTEHLMHKSLSSRRSSGGKLFTIGGGGEAGCSYLVL
mmetsp:Transcript_36571/g.60572  ORF Transcript_36571/g.60572 Transcript_36571/m.60572 type:complete len:126 (+) Transcript_36571:35-412(+)